MYKYAVNVARSLSYISAKHHTSLNDGAEDTKGKNHDVEECARVGDDVGWIDR